MSGKANILLVGGGAVGAMVAYNLESGGLSIVTAVLRSNYHAVRQNGFTIKSIEHGLVDGWKPTNVINSIPRATQDARFDFIVVTTKNIADIKPTVAELISPAVTNCHTSIILVQNGLNIEKPLIAMFPKNPILSGVTLIGAAEIQPGHVIHDHADVLIVSDFENPKYPKQKRVSAAHEFVKLYKASGKVQCFYNRDVGYVRWRKLIYNACYNSICAIAGMDTGRMRLYKFPIDALVRPMMQEILAIAKEAGHPLPDSFIEETINGDPIQNFFKPSMQQDIEKGNFTEFENIVGEPLREAERLGVPAPFLKVAYGILKILQLKAMEEKGLISPHTVNNSPLTPPADSQANEPEATSHAKNSH